MEIAKFAIFVTLWDNQVGTFRCTWIKSLILKMKLKFVDDFDDYGQANLLCPYAYICQNWHF